MRERPIVFGPESVRAILAGSKSQTRRVIKPQPVVNESELNICHPERAHIPLSERVNEAWQAGYIDADCPYGAPGDRLWVRERWAHFFKGETPGACVYLADAGTDRWRQAASEDFALNAWKGMWRSPLLMPRWASRLTLEITEVRVQRVQDLTVADAEAEGIDPTPHAMKPSGIDMVLEYRHAWDALNAKRGFPWSSNPWVWVVEFKRVGGVDKR